MHTNEPSAESADDSPLRHISYYLKGFNMPPIKIGLNQWMAHQPEYDDSPPTFRERTMLERLWVRHEVEAQILRDRAAALSARFSAPVIELQKGDTLLIRFPHLLNGEQRARLKEMVESCIEASAFTPRAAIIEADPSFFILRRAVTEPIAVEVAGE